TPARAFGAFMRRRAPWARFAGKAMTRAPTAGPPRASRTDPATRATAFVTVTTTPSKALAVVVSKGTDVWSRPSNVIALMVQVEAMDARSMYRPGRSPVSSNGRFGS